ncbi:hypothetical protein CISG_09863 [Coccidioides immitis RMSCC 3703]|uniref:Uncharacterized protein n=1 Tax=Coccidioides immitis RMSCC 3703 TaxID=454286 RepID=A0A0J8QKF9_COCIT|nr:hypothetical protein CISG_09863 [Coccidioides immitis RMSCC 3703]
MREFLPPLLHSKLEGWHFNWFRKLLCPVIKNMNIAGNVLLLSHFRRWLKQSCVLCLSLVLDINAKIELNYFSLINVPDHSAPAATTYCLYAAPAPPTTAAAALPPLPPSTTASLPLSGTVRVFTCQMAVPVCLLASVIS